MKKMAKILVATRNPAKVKHYSTLLSAIAEEVVGLDELQIKGKPEELGTTAEENAETKAYFYAHCSGLPVFSEDEALYVDFLPDDQQPGTHVRRINGRDEADDDQLLAHWEQVLAEVPEAKRTGRWHIAYCIATPEGKCNVRSRDFERVFFSPTSKIRIPGWPISSLQGPAEFGKPHSELTEEEKEISKQQVAEELLRCLQDLV